MVLNFEARAANLVMTKQNKNLIELRRSIFRLDEAILNFVMGVTEWVMTEQNKNLIEL